MQWVLECISGTPEPWHRRHLVRIRQRRLAKAMMVAIVVVVVEVLVVAAVVVIADVDVGV